MTRKLQETGSGKLPGSASGFSHRQGTWQRKAWSRADGDLWKLAFCAHYLFPKACKFFIYLFSLDHFISKQWPGIRHRVQSSVAWAPPRTDWDAQAESQWTSSRLLSASQEEERWTGHSQMHQRLRQGRGPALFFFLQGSQESSLVIWGVGEDKPMWVLLVGTQGSTYQCWVYQLPGINVPWSLCNKLRLATNSPAKEQGSNWCLARQLRANHGASFFVFPKSASCSGPLREYLLLVQGVGWENWERSNICIWSVGIKTNKQTKNPGASLLEVHRLLNEARKQIVTTQLGKWCYGGLRIISAITNEVVIGPGGRRESSRKPFLLQEACFIRMLTLPSRVRARGEGSMWVQLREGHSRQREPQEAGTLITVKLKRV